MIGELEHIKSPLRKPTIIKTSNGKERTSTGRWSNVAMAEHIASNPDVMFDVKELARIGYGSALRGHVDAARRNIHILSNILEKRGILNVVEWAGRLHNAIQIFDQENDYHQLLMAGEIGRRKVRRDGSEKRLERLLQALPQSVQPDDDAA